MIYMDYNATSPLRPEVMQAMVDVMERGAMNPSSMHGFGRRARQLVEKARATIADALGAEAVNVVFTGTATEANHQALFGVEADGWVVSAVEHSAVLQVAKEWCEPCVVVPVTNDGLVSADALDAALAELNVAKPCVSIMLANNETGVIQPINELVEVARKYGAFFHCDAVQAFGKIPVSIADLGVDALTISAHKMGGPVGAAALVLNGCQPVQPYMLGGGQETNRRAGTENVPVIVGFAKAVDCVDAQQMQRLEQWRDALEKALVPLNAGVMVAGSSAARLPNTSCITMPDVEASTQLMHFDLAGIAISSGSACTSGKVGRSHVLAAMQLEPAQSDCAIRVSLGWNSKAGDVDAFVDAWKVLFERVHKKAA